MLVLSLLLASAPVLEDFPPVSPGSVSPEIAGAADGTLWTVWIEKEDAPVVRAAKVKGAVWSDPITLAKGEDIVANDADIPQVAVLADGSVVVQWMTRGAGGASSMLVARSKDGRTFAKPVPLGKPSKAERGFARFWSEGGTFRAAWLEDGQLLSAPWADGKFGESTVVDARVCECCQLAVTAAAGGALIAYRDRSDDEVRDIRVVAHQGIAWDEPVSPGLEAGADAWKTPACPVNGPAIDARGGSGGRDIAVAWFSGAGEPSVKVAFSRNGGKSFGDPVRVDAGNPEGRVAVRWIDGTHALVTWVERTEDGNALFASWAKPAAAGEPAQIAAFRGGSSGSHPRLARAGEDLYLAWSDGRGDQRNPKLVRVAKLGRPDFSRARVGKAEKDAAAAAETAAAIDALRTRTRGPSGVRDGDPAPAIDGVDLEGKRVKLADFRGKVVLVSFWGSWCGPCRAEIPEHVEMRKELASKGFEIVSVNSGDSPKVARAYADELGIDYPIVVDDGISQKWRVSGFPTNVVVDKKGTIRGRTQGYSPAAIEGQRKLIEELLAEK